ncbi:MAG: efflux RND transporter periplasmic adaptor subunit, partial [Cyanobacteria bacterium]|nr:efflux RND transporter periplasmic adaptor subunit [Cyanobacteriota bacterium]
KKAAVLACEKHLTSAMGALKQASTSRLNPDIHVARLQSLGEQLNQASEEVQSNKHKLASAMATVKEIEARLAYLSIKSPIEAVVTARAAEPGAVVAAGQTVISLVNLNDVFLRAYVPEGEIGRVRLGQRARIFLDSAPREALAGRVIEVDPIASFTPENTYFKCDRVKQVIGIKIGIDNPAGFAKPGMPADAEILATDGLSWP